MQSQAISDEFLVPFTEEKLPGKACDPSRKLSLDAEACLPSQTEQPGMHDNK